MPQYSVAIIGTGKAHRSDGATGYGTAHWHAQGYLATPGCTLIACADIVPENARAFAEMYNIPHVYVDYREMLSKEQPDIVSVCTWPQLHAQMVVDCANAGAKAVHCEKPMAPTFGEARLMKDTCEKTGTQLTFNHQRRFEERFIFARDMIKAGAVGQLRRLEGSWGNMLDVGTHWIDLLNFYNDDTPADWVIGQVYRAGDQKAFGVDVESQALCYFHCANDVYGLLLMGQGHSIGAEHRILGSEGIIEVDWPRVRIRTKGDASWQVFDKGATEGSVTRGIQDVVASLSSGKESALSAKKAFAATEVIFATYESSRRRGRVELPLTIDDNPLHSMIANGQIG
ncbi:MAG TPA: Gfo/Idh/MocA family oxidoreductase [Candidatus Latescibacteria bacterium]|nr:Gfo/Idh/MocA family oxidoreductase [Candidatus Latescibacterota bacterium]